MAQIQNKILELKEKVIVASALAEKMVALSISGLHNKKSDDLYNVINVNEPKLNHLEIEIDEDCITAIALYHPEAKDLRLVLMISKIISYLERVGDQAVNIAESAAFLIERPDLKPLLHVVSICELTQTMLRDSITAFINEDLILAQEVCRKDNKVDNLHQQLLKELIVYMNDDNAAIERAMHFIRIAHNLERIADLSTNISESTIYVVDGKMVKHQL